MSLTEKQKDAYLKFFDAADADKDGEITIHDLARILRQNKFYGQDWEIANMFVAVDKKKDLVIDREEFMEEMSKNDRSVKIAEQWKEEFDMIDTGKDGFICIKELRAFLKKAKREKDLESILEKLDKNKDGKISYWEFLSDMSN